MLCWSTIKLDLCLHYYQNIHCVFDEYYVCFCLSIALVMVWWWYHLFNVKHFAKVFELIWNKINACVLKLFSWAMYSARIIWQHVIRLSVHWKFFPLSGIYCYNLQHKFITKQVHTDDLTWLACYLMGIYFFFWLCLLNIKTHWEEFYSTFFVCMCIYSYMDSHASSLVYCMPKLLLCRW